MNRSKPVEVRILQFSLPVYQSVYPFFCLHRRLPMRYTLSSVWLAVRLLHRWTARDSICAITVRLSFLRRLSHGCMLYQSKRLKLVSCNFYRPSTYPSIRPSVSQSIHSSVFIARLPCASAPYAVVRSSIYLSVRPSHG